MRRNGAQLAVTPHPFWKSQAANTVLVSVLYVRKERGRFGASRWQPNPMALPFLRALASQFADRALVCGFRLETLLRAMRRNGAQLAVSGPLARSLSLALSSALSLSKPVTSYP